MYIISFDVGIRNLAYIIIEIKQDTSMNYIHNIIQWDVIELCDKDVKASSVDNIIIGKNIVKYLDEKLNDYKFEIILIENQIGQNAIKMKTIQGMLNMYFIMRYYDETNIINYNAVHKLKYFLGKKKTTYNERKKLSKLITQNLCETYYMEKLDYYKKFKKKDDLADCLLQCIDYMRKQNYLISDFYTKICID